MHKVFEKIFRGFVFTLFTTIVLFSEREGEEDMENEVFTASLKPN